MLILSGLTIVFNLCSLCCTSVNPQEFENKQFWEISNDEDDMCQIDDNDEFLQSDVKYRSMMSENIKVMHIGLYYLLYFIIYMQLKTFEKLIFLYM